MKNILKLWLFVALFPVSGNPASFKVTSGGQTYRFGNTNSPSSADAKWYSSSAEQSTLKTKDLREHLRSLVEKKQALQELSRILLAQIPATVPNYNVADNKIAAYAVGKPIHSACKNLKKHMLTHGHLGYYPEFSYIPDRSEARVSRREARGIFNIPYSVSNRIAKDQRRKKQQKDAFYSAGLNSNPSFKLDANHQYTSGYVINDDVHHLWPNIESGQMFLIDPGVSRPKGSTSTSEVNPNLETVADGLIDLLLTAGPPTGVQPPCFTVSSIMIGTESFNRFSITVSYTATKALKDTKGFAVTEDKNIGYHMDGTKTSTVKIVVDVADGVVSIVSMYPITSEESLEN